MARRLSWQRLRAMVHKELLQMMRIPATIGMMIGIPIIQIIMFGYAINNDPKHLPTVLVSADQSQVSTQLVQAISHTGYFRVIEQTHSPQRAKDQLLRSQAQFILHVPANFKRDLVRGLRPTLLLEADATDPVATGPALSALAGAQQQFIEQQLTGTLAHLRPQPTPFEFRVHKAFNPLGTTQLNIVPGLLGVVLTITLIMVTTIAVTRERELGTIELLLATPMTALEVMLGKILPYVLVGYGQVVVILLISHLLIGVPLIGSLLLLLMLCLPFIIANLAVGLLFSTVADNQLQAVQASTFFFLPSILLSGFMFPFRGMPLWAQWIGEILPLRHFVVIARGIMLKGTGFAVLWPHIWPILLFSVVAISLGVLRYRETLD